MTTARDLMTPDPVCARSSDTVLDVAKAMARANVGSLPVLGEDDQLKGMLTDRDIVVRALAEGKDVQALHAGELTTGDPVVVSPDADAEAVLRTMAQHSVRRLPVVGDGRLVGIVAQADVARALPNEKAGELLAAVSD